MEIHRLKPQEKNSYDERMFNQLYKDCKPLISNLVSQIDTRRLGVSRDIVLSWFDDKFMFVFFKYHNERDYNHLKYSLIQALQFFKCRLLRKTYTKKNQDFQNMVSMDDDNKNLKNIINNQEDETENIDEQLNGVLQFLKKELSEEAYFILELQLNPPLFIVDKVKSVHNITPKVILEYINLKPVKENINYIKNLKIEIQEGIKNAGEFFKTAPALN
jgi:hypothetical protein